MISTKKVLVFGVVAIMVSALAYHWIANENTNVVPRNLTILREEDEDEEESGLETKYAEARARYDWLLTRDPKTGKVPENIRAKEMEWVKTQPVRKNGLFKNVDIATSAFGSRSGLSADALDYANAQTGNTYYAMGPTLNGGRTRALAYDSRYDGATNRIILAGGVNGGIFRSTNGGASWTFVHPASEIRSVSCFAQDPLNKNTWYAGTGEAIGVSAGYPSAFIFGNGIFKSIDGGATWSKLASTNVTDPTNLNQWSLIYKIAIHPTTGHIYAAIHRRIVRSIDGGTTWSPVFEGSSTAYNFEGICDLLINKAGSKIFVAMSGRIRDRAIAGLFSSSTGDANSYIRIAGGTNNSADSVAGWRAYDNTQTTIGNYTAGWGRMAIALAPSNQNIMYTLVENTDDATANKPEADLFKCDMSTTPFTWTKLSSNLMAKRNGTTDKYFEAQGGYNMLLGIHPTNPNIVLVGGVNLFRSTDGFATTTNVTFAGGVSSSTYTDADGISHADFHSFAFDPLLPNKVLLGSDGGIAFIDDITAATPTWTNANNQYQTIQYYHVGIDPTPGSRVFYGGAQDNSTTFRDKSGILGSVLPDSNDHYIVLGGDGCQVGMTQKNTAGKQYLFCAAQNGQIYRMKLFDLANNLYTKIKPDNTGDGEFITYYHLDPDNTDYLYYASNDSIFRTIDATNVTSSTWTLMSGVAPVVTGNIFSMATTRGKYTANNHLFIGTSSGKVYRLKDPMGAASTAAPTDITPTGMTGGVVTDISINPRNQDTVMCVVSNYNVNSIFWTGNATSSQPTWQVIEGNLTVPSVRSCEIVAKTSGVEYYVGTSTGLFSTGTLNGSSTVWAREVGVAGQPSEMMNTAIVNTMAYRWVDNTLVIGTHGNGMFAAFLGSPVTVTTAVTTPIRNNINFIRTAYPTITDNVIKYQVGDMYSIRKLSVQVTNMNGQIIYKNDLPYQDASIPLSRLSPGTYVLTVTSNDRKYQYTKKFIKN